MTLRFARDGRVLWNRACVGRIEQVNPAYPIAGRKPWQFIANRSAWDAPTVLLQHSDVRSRRKDIRSQLLSGCYPTPEQSQ